MIEGLVMKSTGSWYKVKQTDGDIIDCKIKGRFRMDDLKSTNPIAVGDKVSFDMEKDGTGIISDIHTRKNYIIRKASNLSKQSHIIAANIDKAFLVVTIRQPQTYSLFVDRFLVTAEAYSIPVTLVFNKIDTYNEKDNQQLLEWKHIYQSAQYKCLETSTVDMTNIDSLREMMQNQVSVFVGNSGVGKSSLVNIIDSSLSIKTANVSKSNKKGQHTTTFAEMYCLEGGGYIIDTPGLKAFGLLEMEKWEISHYFPEMFALLKDCQYSNCTHIHEPGCNVRKALEEGTISKSRYQNYLSLMNDEDDKHRKGY